MQTTKETLERIQRLNAENSTEGTRRLCSNCNGTGIVRDVADRPCGGCGGGGIVVD